MFSEGVVQTMDQILTHREKRANKQLELLNGFKKKQLVVLTLNIPGPIKNNPWLSELFAICAQDVKKEIEQYWLINQTEEINEPSGMAYFIVVSASINELKQKMIEMEETHPMGRLIDIDVVTLKDTKVVPVSREMFDCSPRKCFVCEKSAKICARNRTHSLEELEAKIVAIYQEAKRSKL